MVAPCLGQEQSQNNAGAKTSVGFKVRRVKTSEDREESEQAKTRRIVGEFLDWTGRGGTPVDHDSNWRYNLAGVILVVILALSTLGIQASIWVWVAGISLSLGLIAWGRGFKARLGWPRR